MSTPVHVPAVQGPGYAVVGERIHVLAHAAQTGGGEAFLQEGPAGSGPPPHTHPWDESYYMLSGEMDVLLGERTITLTPGGFVFIPAGTPHNFRYRTEGKFFSFTSAKGAADFFADLDRHVPPGPPDLEQVIGIAARNRVTLAGPPPTR